MREGGREGGREGQREGGTEGGREGEYTHVHAHTMYMYIYILPSKLHVCFFPSPSLPTLHMSSILLICVAVICRALACSLSDGCFTSQFRKQRSWISGIQEVGFLGGREAGREGGREGRKEEMKEKKYAEIREREKYTCTSTLYSLLSLPPSPSPSPSPSPPVHVLQAALLGAGMAAQQHHDGVTLGRNEAQQKHVPVPTVVALQYGLPQRTIFVECDLLTASPNQVVDYVTVEGRGGEEEEEEEGGGGWRRGGGGVREG